MYDDSSPLKTLTRIQIWEDHFGTENEVIKSIWDVKKEIDEDINFKRKIIKLFLDNKRDEDAPFSIQNFVEHGYVRYGKMPGDWYGINSVANVMETLNSYYKPDRSLEIVVFNDLGISPSRCIKIAGINCTCQNFRKESIDEEDEGFVNLHRKVR